MEHPERREAGGRVRLRWGDQDERERADKVDKDQNIQELHEELAVARVTADEARARAGAGELRVRKLEEDRGQLREKVRRFEEEERGRRRRREGQDRRVTRLERELERRENDIRHL